MVTPSDIVTATPKPITIDTDGASRVIDALAVAWNGANKIYVVTPADIAGAKLEAFRAPFRAPDPGYALYEPSELPAIWDRARDLSDGGFVGNMSFIRTWGLESLVEQGHDASITLGPAPQAASFDEWLERDDSLDAQLENGRLPEGPDDGVPPIAYHDSAGFPGFKEGSFDFDVPFDPPAPPAGARMRANVPSRLSDPHHDQSALSDWSHESPADEARRRAGEELESTGIAVDPDTGMTMGIEDDGLDLG